jgi:hypothetical protein
MVITTIKLFLDTFLVQMIYKWHLENQIPDFIWDLLMQNFNGLLFIALGLFQPLSALVLFFKHIHRKWLKYYFYGIGIFLILAILFTFSIVSFFGLNGKIVGGFLAGYAILLAVYFTWITFAKNKSTDITLK